MCVNARMQVCVHASVQFRYCMQTNSKASKFMYSAVSQKIDGSPGKQPAPFQRLTQSGNHIVRVCVDIAVTCHLNLEWPLQV